jgi:hypothetical protein
MVHRIALIVLGLSSLLILFTFVGLGSPVLFALVAGNFPVALIALGTVRRGRMGPMVWVILCLGLTLEVTLGGLLLLRGTVLTGPSWFGLPRVAALQLLGLFMLPLVITGFGYAWTFDQWTLREQDLKRLRARFGSAPSRASGPPRASGHGVSDRVGEDEG